jgi:hypothetical protein
MHLTPPTLDALIGEVYPPHQLIHIGGLPGTTRLTVAPFVPNATGGYYAMFWAHILDWPYRFAVAYIQLDPEAHTTNRELVDHIDTEIRALLRTFRTYLTHFDLIARTFPHATPEAN